MSASGAAAAPPRPTSSTPTVSPSTSRCKRSARHAGRRPGDPRRRRRRPLDRRRARRSASWASRARARARVARLVLRLMPVTVGQVFFEGDDITDVEGRVTLRALRHRMQLVFQDPYSSFDPQATVLDSVIEPLRAQRRERRRRARRGPRSCSISSGSSHGVPRTGTRASSPAGSSSGPGSPAPSPPNPQLVVLDEPVSALDVSTQAQVINLLEDLQRELGIAFLFIAHDLAVVRHVSDRIAVMYLGQIVEEGPAAALYDAPTHPYTLRAALGDPGARTRAAQRARPRVLLQGEIPSPANPPSGCRFRTRCPFAMDDLRRGGAARFVTPSGRRIAVPPPHARPDARRRADLDASPPELSARPDAHEGAGPSGPAPSPCSRRPSVRLTCRRRPVELRAVGRVDDVDALHLVGVRRRAAVAGSVKTMGDSSRRVFWSRVPRGLHCRPALFERVLRDGQRRDDRVVLVPAGFSTVVSGRRTRARTASDRAGPPSGRA